MAETPVAHPFADSPEFCRLVDGDPAADLARIALECGPELAKLA